MSTNTANSMGEPLRKRRRTAAKPVEPASDYEVSDEQPEPAQTKKKKKAVTKPAAKTRRGNLGKLSNLMHMPMDVFIEIISHLEPLDLLRLSRSNKFLRSILMTKSSRGMWKASRLLLEGMPGCPGDMSEPAYAHFVFETVCDVCGSTRASKVDFHIRVRACKKCIPAITMSLWDARRRFLDLPSNGTIDVLVRMVPCSRESMFRCKRSAGEPILRDYVEVSKSGDEGAVIKFIEDKEKLVREQHEHGNQLDAWVQRRSVEKSVNKNSAVQGRKQSILTKLAELGWDEKDTHDSSKYAGHEYHRLVEQPAALSPAIWRRIKPKLESILEQRKAVRLEREKQARIESRKAEASQLIKTVTAAAAKAREDPTAYIPWQASWEDTYPVSTDLYDLPSIAALILNDEVPITRDMWLEAQEAIEDEVSTFQMKVRAALANALRKADAVSTDTISSEKIRVDISPLTNPSTDLDDLRAADPANISLLSEPWAVFNRVEIIFSYSTDMLAYPFVLRGRQSRLSISAATAEVGLTSVSVEPATRRMAKVLAGGVSMSDNGGGSDQEMSGLVPQLTMASVLFKPNGSIIDQWICECCSDITSIPRTWYESIQHVIHEKQWYTARHAQSLRLQEKEQSNAGPASSSSISAPPIITTVIDDHATPRIRLLADDAAVDEWLKRAHDAELSNDGGNYVRCGVCEKLDEQTPLSGATTRDKRYRQIAHLKQKHGLEGENATKYLQALPPFFGHGWDPMSDDSYGSEDDYYDEGMHFYGGLFSMLSHHLMMEDLYDDEDEYGW